MIQLPKADKEGKPYISYSQANLWESLKSFNLGVEGRLEYMVQYFHGKKFGDKGWAEFGTDVENYIRERIGVDKFDEEERTLLNKIEPLGTFEKECWLDMGDFNVLMYVDDMNDDMSLIRDYKTGSMKSLKKYEQEDYFQLDLYASWVFEKTGVLPKAEVVRVERKGNCMFSGGREVLRVGNHWDTLPITITEQKVSKIKQNITKTALEISEHFIIYKKLHNIK